MKENKVKLFILRLDLSPTIPSGNKYFKLKYNIKQALSEGKTGLLTFGGAYSNHILATAKATNELGLKSKAIIRGDPPKKLNPTLQEVTDLGMQLKYISRTMYRMKRKKGIKGYSEKFLEANKEYFIIPEGGTNEYALKGTAEIVQLINIDFDYLCCSGATGGTIAGLSTAIMETQQLLGFPALKGGFVGRNVEELLEKYANSFVRPFVFDDYHFGRYGKVPDELKAFIIQFYEETNIPLDPIYTSKMMFGILDLIKKKYFKENSTIIAIHTGGLQGLRGFPDLHEKLMKS